MQPPKETNERKKERKNEGRKEEITVVANCGKRNFSLTQPRLRSFTAALFHGRKRSLADFVGLFAGTRSPLSYSVADTRLTNCNEILYMREVGCIRCME